MSWDQLLGQWHVPFPPSKIGFFPHEVRLFVTSWACYMSFCPRLNYISTSQVIIALVLFPSDTFLRETSTCFCFSRLFHQTVTPLKFLLKCFSLNQSQAQWLFSMCFLHQCVHRILYANILQTDLEKVTNFVSLRFFMYELGQNANLAGIGSHVKHLRQVCTR